MKTRENFFVRDRFTGHDRRRLKRARQQARQVGLYRRVDAVLLVAQGHSLDEAARHVGCSVPTVRRWAVRYLQTHDAQALADRRRCGRPRIARQLTASHLAGVLGQDPRQFGYSATSWTAPLLAAHLRRHHNISISVRTLRRRLHEARYRWKRPRYFYSERAAHVGQKKGGSFVA